MFTATNTSDGLDPSVRHYWRWHTYDYYTGVSWGVNNTLVGNTQVMPEFSVEQGVADQSFWNHSGPLSWEIIFDEAGYIGPGRELIQPFNVVNYTTWVDFTAGLNFSNYTRDVIVDSAVIEALYVNAPEVILTTEITDNSTAFDDSEYGKDLPQDFLDNGDFVINLTQDILDQSGAISAWDKIKAPGLPSMAMRPYPSLEPLRLRRPDGMGSDSDILIGF